MPSSSEAAVLAANAAFYRAFAERDEAAMEALWAREAPVACVHPGWEALVGRAAVLESWRDILANPSAPRVECLSATAHVMGDAAFVLAVESIQSTELVATNLFVREDGAWKMVHHHAGLLAGRRSRRPPPAAPPKPKSSLN
jgi:ketosteroid isomerase-like protein